MIQTQFGSTLTVVEVDRDGWVTARRSGDGATRTYAIADLICDADGREQLRRMQDIPDSE